jgi:dUTP pyrophosphatase
MITVRVQQLPHAAGLPLPAQATAQAAGLDLRAAVAETMQLAPHQWAAVPTGLCLELPAGTEGQVRPRSGLAAKHGVTVLNSPGTVDADYRGEVMVLLINHGSRAFEIKRGDRIAQLVVSPVPEVRLVPVVELTESGRGAGGHGSTGVA